jgi:membrane-bound serine protease (ClpP class)
MLHIAVALLVFGVVFLLIEAFVPGFGFFGISGTVLIVCSALYSAFFVPDGYVIAGGEALLVVGVCIFVCFYYKSHKNTMRVILNETLNEDTDKTDFECYIGKTGVVKTPMRPFGNVEIDGEYVEAYAEKGYIQSGKTVVCRYVKEGKLYVREV